MNPQVTRYYICDRKKCENCPKECRHTTDINHALYKEHTDFVLGGFFTEWEVKRNDHGGKKK